MLAESLLETDRQSALAVARGSFSDPATMFLPRFLYVAAGADRAAADAFYREALAAYAARDDIDALLYLSQYPFALTSAIAPVTPNMGTRQPAGCNADPELQRLFVNAFLGFAERRLAAIAQQPPAEGRPYQRTEPEAVYTALKVLGWVYLRRGHKAVSAGDLDEARRLGDKYLRASAVPPVVSKTRRSSRSRRSPRPRVPSGSSEDEVQRHSQQAQSLCLDTLRVRLLHFAA